MASPGWPLNLIRKRDEDAKLARPGADSGE
jgi:hypothetical protein